MSKRTYPGIYTHEGLVYPSVLEMDYDKDKIILMEPGFTFQIPTESKRRLAITFLKAIKSTMTEDEYQEKLLEIKEKYKTKERILKLVK